MRAGRIVGFSDGVIAIAITVMVLKLRSPAGTGAASLLAQLPVFSSYVLSFVYLGIYWSNHHNLFQAVERVNGAVLWANLHLLFWLTLVPFTTAWMGENHFAAWPTAVYGIVLLLAGVAYYILVRALVALHGKTSALAGARPPVQGQAVRADVRRRDSVGIRVPVGRRCAVCHGRDHVADSRSPHREERCPMSSSQHRPPS